jgi:hypothetical protein
MSDAELAALDKLSGFTYAHVFMPYGNRARIRSESTLCGECQREGADTAVFLKMKAVLLCRDCLSAHRAARSIIVVHRSPDTGQFRWIGPDAKDAGPKLSIAVKDWYNEWAQH